MPRMNRFSRALVLLFVTASTVPAFAEDTSPPKLNCQAGPLHRSYAKGEWLLYACDDGRSLVAVTDKGNPAMPFYFMFYVRPDGEMTLHGEGEGDKAATQAAFDELKTLTQDDVAALVRDANAAGEKRGSE